MCCTLVLWSACIDSVSTVLTGMTVYQDQSAEFLALTLEAFKQGVCGWLTRYTKGAMQKLRSSYNRCIQMFFHCYNVTQTPLELGRPSFDTILVNIETLVSKQYD